jgi:7-carboxy-7-deazaguanine synthase (Cx14CxxC type)
MTYSVKEIFYTLQGEGANAGRPAVFCRFTGCNLWTGREEDRIKAICQFCDTDFVGTDGMGGGKFPDADTLALTVAGYWPMRDVSRRFVVLTGGEPLLQVDEALTRSLKAHGFTIAVETNGSCSPPPGIDWICVSPKAGAKLIVHSGQELKLVFPQNGLDPSDFEGLPFENFYVQPMDGPLQAENTKQAIEYCKSHPRWNLSVQTHKIVGIR